MKLRHVLCFVIVSLLSTLWMAWMASMAAGTAAAGPGGRAQNAASEAGLRQAEILAAQSVSRSIFAAQKSERAAAEHSGLMALGRELKRLQESTAALQAVPTRTARVEVTGRAATPMQPAQPSRRAANRGGAFERAHSNMLEKKKALRSKLAALHATRQRALAQGLLQRLDEMEPMLKNAASRIAAGTSTPADLEALSFELGAPKAAQTPRAAPPPPAPTMTTRIQHRREIPHVQ